MRPKRWISLVLLVAACGRFGGRVLKFSDAVQVKVEKVGTHEVRVAGGIFHSGLCVANVEQRKTDDTILLRVHLKQAHGKCSGAFMANVDTTGIREIQLGDDRLRDSDAVGTIWTNVDRR